MPLKRCAASVVNGKHLRRQDCIMGNSTRSMAFRTIAVVLFGTAVGSVLPETGNAVVILVDKGPDAHIYNPVFLAVGIIGIMLALYIGYRKCK